LKHEITILPNKMEYWMKLARIFLIGLLFVSAAVSADYSRDQAMTVAQLNGIDIAYTSVGDINAPSVLMIMGLTGSHRVWREDFINGLAAAGYRVILFDNRDTGESARLDALGEPAVWWQWLKNTAGFKVDGPYSLNDMAADSIAVLDALDIEKAHIVGASMGGMIAQIIAAEYPQRAASLVSIMSSTGARHLPKSERRGENGREGMTEAELHDLGFHLEAVPRQLTAIYASGDRSEQVRTIAVPTLVLHGEDDTVLPVAHGLHTHELIPGSTYISYPGMGHSLPTELVSTFVSEMTNHFTAAAESGVKTNPQDLLTGMQLP
jgi:pimeloyl-ACP methyl ester carboxylesterase